MERKKKKETAHSSNSELCTTQVDSMFHSNEYHVSTGEIYRTHLALTPHLVALTKALLLGGTHGFPGHDEITQNHVHLAVGLRLAWKHNVQTKQSEPSVNI